MLRPTSEADLAEAIASAQAPLSIRGGGTRGVETDGTLLTVDKITGVEIYEPGALTLVVRAGTPMAEIDALLAIENQRLAFEPMDHRALLGTDGTPTIGGVIAGNISGPRRIQAGAARDFLLGVRYIDGTGTAIKNGGRVMKNVTGYDLVKLMAGSWGTLGVLSEVSLKVLPANDAEATLSLPDLTPEAAVAAMSATLGAPFEVSGAAHRPGGDTLIRIEGFAASVSYRAGRLREVLAPFGAAEITEDPVVSREIWRGIRDVSDLVGNAGDIWRVSVKPTEGPELLTRAGSTASLMDWGGGLIWLAVPEGTDLRSRLDDFDGHATLIRAARATRDRLGVFQPEAPALAAITRGLRARFDPKGLFNRGLMQDLVEA